MVYAYLNSMMQALDKLLTEVDLALASMPVEAPIADLASISTEALLNALNME